MQYHLLLLQEHLALVSHTAPQLLILILNFIHTFTVRIMMGQFAVIYII
jgi:hypothetical protein